MKVLEKSLTEIEQEIEDFKKLHGCTQYPGWLIRRKVRIMNLLDVFSRAVR